MMNARITRSLASERGRSARATFAARARSGQGMSLVEATIILMVMATLTAVIAPSAGDYIEESRNTKAKEDVEAIGTGIARLMRDSGLACVSLAGSACSKAAGRVELLVSGPDETLNLPTSDAAPYGTNINFASAATLNWAGATTTPVGVGTRDLMDPHLVTNTAGYAPAGFTGGGGPRNGVGWRGAYLNGPIDVDPWGYVYQASAIFLGVATDASIGNGEGALSGGWSADVMVISAGSNGNIQTLFGALGGAAVGDDVAFVLQGSTR